MSAKQCLWAKFRATCATESECLEPGMMPTRCIWCGWDADREWENCLKPLSPAMRAIEEIIAEEKPGQYPPDDEIPF